MTSMNALVARYNELATSLGLDTVARFSDKATAAKRIERLETVTVAPAQLAGGLVNRDAQQSARAIQEAKGKTAPATPAQPEAIPAAAPKAKAPAAAPKAKAPAAARGESKGIINSAGRIVLKANKEVRAALKAAAKLAGGTRLDAQGFDSFSAFLNGFAANEGGKRQTIINFKVVGTEAKVKLVVATDGTWVVN